MKQVAGSHRLRKNRSQQPGIFFVTKCLAPKIPALRIEERELIQNSFKYCVDRGQIDVGAFVILPDHWHCLVGLYELSLSIWMHQLMSYVGGKTSPLLLNRGTRWQVGYYDTEVRTKRQFDSMVNYIHANPVRRGLVEARQEWPNSSIHRQPWIRLAWWFED